MPAKKSRKPSRSAARSAKPKVPRKKPRKQPESFRVRQITPSITVNDLKKSIAFYTDGLGFLIDERWEQGGTLMGVMLKAGRATFALSQDNFAKGRDRVKGVGYRLWVYTAQDLAKLASRVKAFGVVLDREPSDTWGDLSFDVTDPDGFQLTIVRDKARG